MKKFTIRPPGWHEHFKANYQMADVEVVAYTFAEACLKMNWRPENCQKIAEEEYHGERLNQKA